MKFFHHQLKNSTDVDLYLEKNVYHLHYKYTQSTLIASV